MPLGSHRCLFPGCANLCHLDREISRSHELYYGLWHAFGPRGVSILCLKRSRRATPLLNIVESGHSMTGAPQSRSLTCSVPRAIAFGVHPLRNQLHTFPEPTCFRVCTAIFSESHCSFNCLHKFPELNCFRNRAAQIKFQESHCSTISFTTFRSLTASVTALRKLNIGVYMLHDLLKYLTPMSG